MFAANPAVVVPDQFFAGKTGTFRSMQDAQVFIEGLMVVQMQDFFISEKDEPEVCGTRGTQVISKMW